jgi:capsular exopolysaccharide synthesis family protein
MLSLARELGDRSVRSRADVLAAAGLQVLGAIPRVNRQKRVGPRSRTKPGEEPEGHAAGNDKASVAVGVLPATGSGTAAKLASLLVTQPGTPAAYIESFNQLFANLALVYRERALKVILFASPLPGDGKTLTATNFALIGASRGLRVLLIDADMRCGMASAVLGCTREPGLAELLDGTVEVGETLRRVTVGERTSLMVVPSGALANAHGPLLTLDRVQKLIDTLAPEFDFIVIDTPPVNLLADAALLASGADAVLLVVRAGRTHAAAVRYAMDQLEATHAPVLGALLNDIDLRRHASDDDAYRYIAEAERYRARPREPDPRQPPAGAGGTFTFATHRSRS